MICQTLFSMNTDVLLDYAINNISWSVNENPKFPLQIPSTSQTTRYIVS